MSLRSIGWVLLLSVAACGEEGNAELAARLRTCDLLTEGETPPLPVYAPNDCYLECLAGASCESLASSFCGDIALRRRCDEECADRCDDGSLIAVEARCNGVMQCAGGEDEEGCETFACRDGTRFAVAARCDRAWNCAEGEDEQDCPMSECSPYTYIEGCPSFECGDGRMLPVEERCSGYPACPDLSDEAGCAMLTPMCDDAIP